MLQPNFCAELGGIVNIESLVELSRQIRDGGGLDTKSIRDHRFRLAQGELNADFRLRNKAALRVLCDVLGKYACGDEPFGFERENAIAGRNLHARRRVGGAARSANDALEKLQDWRWRPIAGGRMPGKIDRLASENYEQMLEAGCLKDDLCVRG